MKFLPLIDLRIKHRYYADGRCLDFTAEPDSETASLLKNHRCVFRPVPDGARVLASVDANDDLFLPLRPDTVFVFHLYLQNPDFTLTTDLTTYRAAAAPVFTNAGSPDQLALVSRQERASESFAVRQPTAQEPFTLSGNPAAGIALADFGIDGLDNINRPAAYDATAKIMTVNTRSVQPGHTFTVTYPIVPSLAKGVFADVEIHLNPSNLKGGPGAFEIEFQPRQARWQYYVITDRTGGEFQIEDRDTSPIRFSSSNRTNLNQQPDSLDSIAQTLAAQFPDLQRFRFVSDDRVPFQQKPRKSIQLRFNGDQVVDPLPNPSLRNFTTLSTGQAGHLQKEDAVFHIIRYFSPSVSN